ncbi:hypothetical protein [Candidatus Merdisoma sp. JLR.KK006]|uniref:hypothetical protein n=1 Tax=Candidatus Merdisoma sp. JLR.KK006 TaxID=3112626 RepID=UPI002FF00620
MKRLTYKARYQAGYKANRDVRVWECIDKLGQLEDLEEQGRLLKLPCAVGDTVYCIYNKYTKCIEYGQRFSAHNCEGCPAKCDSREEYYIEPKKVYNLDWIVAQIKHFGKRVFLTKEAAKAALKEMRE